MNVILILSTVFVFVSCANGKHKVNVDSSNVITDSAALMSKDTTTVIGAGFKSARQIVAPGYGCYYWYRTNNSFKYFMIFSTLKTSSQSPNFYSI